jgi:hypothetical protein
LLLKLRHSVNRADIEYLAGRVLGPQSFSLGVCYGMGAQLVDGVVEIAKLVKTLVLADLHDKVHGRSVWQGLSMMAIR